MGYFRKGFLHQGERERERNFKYSSANSLQLRILEIQVEADITSLKKVQNLVNKIRLTTVGTHFCLHKVIGNLTMYSGQRFREGTGELREGSVESTRQSPS